MMGNKLLKIDEIQSHPTKKKDKKIKEIDPHEAGVT